MKPRTIVVEGPIAVGKTSLCQRLAEALGFRLVLEESEENPFLRRFYENPEKYAFTTQVFFLLNRYRQQQELAQLGLFEQGAVCDYLFAKDRVFAGLNLDQDELALYDQIYRLLEPRLARPDLVVYLEARTDVLWKRMRRRDRSFERRLAPAYLDRVAEAYRQFFHRYTETPLLVVESSDIDFIERPHDFADLLKQIQSARKGTRYYVPLGSS